MKNIEGNKMIRYLATMKRSPEYDNIQDVGSRCAAELLTRAV